MGEWLLPLQLLQIAVEKDLGKRLSAWAELYYLPIIAAYAKQGQMRLMYSRHIKTNSNIKASCVTDGTKELLNATSPSCYLPAAPDWVFPLG